MKNLQIKSRITPRASRTIDAYLRDIAKFPLLSVKEESDLARRMLSNSDFILMFNQSPSDRAELEKLLNISSRQGNYVTNVSPGQGLLFTGVSVIPFTDRFPIDSSLYKIMTTKPEETSG